MKKTIGLGVLSVAAMALLIGIFAGQKNEYKVAQGYTVSSLPTTIDLKDTSASDIRSYYSSLNSLDTSERQGTNLLKNLKTILRNGQKYYSYDDGKNTIWQMYEIIDRDWDRSPASSISGYNSSTKKITGYTYGTSNSSPGTDPYVHALYINRNVTNQTKAWGNHEQDEWGINREHVWPKAEGFNDSGAGGARGDPMHLMCGNGYSNNIHSNYYYGYVKTSSSYTDCGSTYSNQSGNLRGTSKTLNSGTVFEPQDCDKGDIARAIFYMAARYNYFSGSDSDGISSNNPNLVLTQDINDWSKSSYTSSTTKAGKMGILSDLLAWHHADPVDQYEIHRNNLLYTNFTNNRNPFIDFPEWVDYIWGTATYSGTTYQSYSSTPTGYATPSSDTINGYNSTTTPKVNSVTVSPDTLNLDLNGTKTGTLTATVSVSNGASKTVSWSISPSGQGVTVSNGTVTAANNATVGNYTVTATSTYDNTKYGTCSVSLINTAVAWEDTLVDATMTKGPSYSYDDATVNGNAAIKVGTSSNPGTMTIKVSAGAKILRFYAAAWKNYPCTLNIEGGTVIPSSVNLIADNGINNSSPFTLSGNESDYLFNLNLRNVNSETTLTLSPSGATRFVIWGAQYSTQVPNLDSTSISASVIKNFYVGDTITANDVIIKDNNNNYIADFEFDDYYFTYDDAPSGGVAIDTVNFIIPYKNLTATLEVPVSRTRYIAPSDITSFLGNQFTDLGTSYKTGQTITVDTIDFKIDGYCFNNKISLSSNSSNAPGSIINTSAFANAISYVYIDGATPDIQLSTNGTDWVDMDEASPELVNYYYFKVFYKTTAQSGYVNINRIDVYTKNSASDTALALAHYIMFEDTEGQCTSKYDYAAGVFTGLSKSERTVFMTTSDYVITLARERLIAWALIQNKTISPVAGDYVISTQKIMPLVEANDNNSLIIIVSISSIGFSSLVLFILKYKKKED